jgi:hypothetical protein
MEKSILNSVKLKVNVTPENHEFDNVLIDYINMSFGTLHQLGIGPVQGFMIEDATATWDDFLRGDARLNGAITFVAMKVRMAFDPPQAGPMIAAMEKQMAELEWRLNVVREGVVYGTPIYNPGSGTGGGTTTPTDGTLDGGGPVDSGGETYDGGKP